ncbi:hypothetical protein [Nocardia jiangxiensis]|uniref:hypothetical protein n=1 Tax=Nocardia jiangxiensis TaxID=282685 RepID=UPI0003060583|nr:hypothetical protein [Nocardia jiangxiensis]
MSTNISDIDLDDLEDEIRRLAAETPEYVYPDASCVYVKRKLSGGLCGSCLFGVALINLGVDPEQLDVGSDTSITALLADHGFEKTPQIEWFQTVQNLQDDCYPWGRAVKMADPYEGVGA